jgi:hypothetical protein
MKKARGKQLRRLEVDEMEMLLAAANDESHTEAVVWRCLHYTGRHGIVMNVESYIAHRAAGCTPWRVCTSMKEMRAARGAPAGGNGSPDTHRN